MDIVTLVVAILGVMLALASLVWQAATFVLSGSRVRVALRRGALRRDAHGVARISGPLQPSAEEYVALRKQGFTEDLLIVDVRNVGRLAVSVERITMDAIDGWGYAVAADPENAALPHRLEPGTKQSWQLSVDVLQRVVDMDSKPREVWMTVELGTGKVLRTREHAKLVPSQSVDGEAATAPPSEAG